MTTWETGADLPDALEPFVAALRLVLADAETVVYIVATDGRVTECNDAFCDLMDIRRGDMCGGDLTQLLSEHDAIHIQRIIDGQVPPESPVLLNFSSSSTRVKTFKCRIRCRGASLVIVGEMLHENERRLRERLLEMNQELAVANRELARRERELERTRVQLQETLDDLNDSYWHLKKIQEVLPICMGCNKVKTGDAEWEDVVDYLKDNSLFLSHGYCPVCAEKLTGRWTGDEGGAVDGEC